MAIERENIDWKQISNKPSTFTPSPHSHDYSDLLNKPTIPTKTSELVNDSKTFHVGTSAPSTNLIWIDTST